MPASAAVVLGVTRWTTAKDAATVPGVGVRTVWKWVRSGQVRAKRLPGERGRVLVAVDADGFPVLTAGPTRRRRQ